MTRIRRTILAGCSLALLLPVWPADEPAGRLEVKSKPSRAGVFIDGRYAGPAANFAMRRRFAVTPGSHEIRVSHAGYQDATAKVDVQAGKTTVHAAELTKIAVAPGPYARLRVYHADRFAAVTINGAYVGFIDEVDNPFEWIQLPVGEHVIVVTPSNGGAPVERKIKLGANEELKLRLP